MLSREAPRIAFGGKAQRDPIQFIPRSQSSVSFAGGLLKRFVQAFINRAPVVTVKDELSALFAEALAQHGVAKQRDDGSGE